MGPGLSRKTRLPKLCGGQAPHAMTRIGYKPYALRSVHQPLAIGHKLPSCEEDHADL